MAIANGINPSVDNINVGGINISTGTGAPTFTAVKGSIYVRLDGSSTVTRMYINTTGATTWTPITTSA